MHELLLLLPLPEEVANFFLLSFYVLLYFFYLVKILITAVNFIFIVRFLKEADKSNVIYRYRYIEVTVACLVFLLSIVQICIFAGVIPTTMERERAAHFCEFTTEIFNGMFAFLYAVVVYNDMRRCTHDHYSAMKKV